MSNPVDFSWALLWVSSLRHLILLSIHFLKTSSFAGFSDNTLLFLLPESSSPDLSTGFLFSAPMHSGLRPLSLLSFSYTHLSQAEVSQLWDAEIRLLTEDLLLGAPQMSQDTISDPVLLFFIFLTYSFSFLKTLVLGNSVTIHLFTQAINPEPF